MHRPDLPMHRRTTCALILAAFSIAAVIVWSAMGRPVSISEARFLYLLSEQGRSATNTLNLNALMPGEWELVCGANGYAGDFHLKNYKRTYPSVGDLQDGAWGLVFISADGSFISAAGDCRSAQAYISLEGCVSRQHAVLLRQSQGRKCPSFGGPRSHGDA